MKILITILLALFISSNANANEDLRNLCGLLQRYVVDAYDRYLDQETVRNADIIRDELLKDAKLYHYMDCADFR